MENNIALTRELREWKNEQIIQENTLKAEQQKISDMLKGDMGKDIHDVLSGKKQVKLSKFDIFKYKLNYYINKILRAL